MRIKYGLHKCLQFGLAGLLGSFCVSLLTSKTQAQQSNIVPDNTLGAESSQVINNFQGQPTEVITGGATRQINLFHSFQEFNVSEGRGAYFLSPSANIQNILARVTGNNPSEILGQMGTFQIINGSLVGSNANLFLINPNGIVFGKNASLDVQGSFVGTTANGVQFGNQGVFSATNPQTAPLLTINPSALLFNQIQTSGGIINQSQAAAGTNPIGNNVTGLRVADGKSLLLVGGNINIDGGGIHAYGGNVELAGLAAPGNVGLNIAGDNLGLIIPENVERADVSLSNGAEVNVSGAGGGNIKIEARNVNLAGESKLRAGIDTGLGTPNSKSGDISINATGKTTLINQSAIANVVQEKAFGQAGEINIATGILTLSEGAVINANLYGQGNAGNVNINALENIAFDSNSDASSSVYNQGVGNGGNIYLKTSLLSLTNGGQISTSVSGQGNAGNITVEASDNVKIDSGFLDTNSDASFTGLQSNLNIGGVGKAGNIQITTGSLSVTNSAGISSFTAGVGNAGNITINVRDNVTFSGFGGVGKPGSQVSSYGDYNKAIGNGGDIRITADNLLLKDGAQLAADNGGQGNGGNIFLDVGNTITFDGVGGDGMPSSAKTEAFNGNAGNIQIQTRSLFLTNGGTISSSHIRQQDITTVNPIAVSNGDNINQRLASFFLTNGGIVDGSTPSKGNAGNIRIDASDRIVIDGISTTGFYSGVFSIVNPTSVGNGGNINLTTDSLFLNRGGISSSSFGQGKAGDININSGSTTIDNQGFIAAITNSSDGGNINLNVDDLLLLRNGSAISTTAGTAQLGGNGGNININSRFIVAIPKENSDITANAFTGTGGNVQINSQGIFGIKARPKPTEKSDITASSELGFAGVIKIYAPDTSSIQNTFTELPPNIDTNALIANSCISRGTKRQENSFTITGSGALTTNRPGVLVSNYTTGEVRGVETASRPWKKGDPIIEPQGLYRLNNGQLLLSRECSN